ncbi:alpha/beta hydrolase [Metabacillus sp. 84]|uniref:alpha/beta hydrolase n=1 Tax=unclassified Metabacillus TaxID=2675274 RepID=UPI003CF2C781
MFHEVEKKLISLFLKKDWDEAYALLVQEEPNYPEKLHKFSFWKACLQCILNQQEDAMKTLQNAFDRGFWWNPDLLKNDPDLSPLQDRKSFNALVRDCEKRKEEALKEAKPLVEFHGSQDPSAAIVVLHGRGGSMEDTIPYWMNEMSVRDYLFAFPQSSQTVGYNAYSWDDGERAQVEIKEVISKILKDYPDVKRILIAGFSQGGKTAIQLALSGELDRTNEFYAVVPAIREDDLHMKAAPGVSGWIIAGTEDPFWEDTMELKERLEKQRVVCRFMEFKEMAHTYPEQFSELLQESLQ